MLLTRMNLSNLPENRVSTASLSQMPSTDQSARAHLDARINLITRRFVGGMMCVMKRESFDRINKKKETDAVKEEKKLMKHFQKMVPLYVQKKRNHLRHLNEMEKKLVDIVKDEKKLLKLIRSLKCANRWDAGKLIKHFGMEIRFLP